jgi:polyisoprenoid-binding protein YceI
MRNFKTGLVAAAMIVAAAGAQADGHAKGWTLNAEMSNVSFASIKNNYNGESHSFSSVSGTVAADGTAEITLDLASVETNIDIRNERMREFVFKSAPSATITAALDMNELNALGVGQGMDMETSGTLSLLGVENELDASLYVMRIAQDTVMVTTNGMIMLDVDDAELTGSIDKLQELASLDGITRVSPVTLRLVFNADG